MLLRRWSKAKSGEGQVVLLSGEAGIGKSRLTAALLERLAGEPHTRLRYFCSPQHTDSALYPIIGQMERAAGLAHDDTPQAKLDKLDAVLAQTSTSIEDAALFAEMLSLPNDGRYPALDLDPPRRRQKTLEALVSQMEALARQNPVLMIFEDAHWTDPTSLEAFGRTVDRIAGLRVLLIVTFRPEFEPPWIGRPHVTALTINRLTRREIDAMIDRVAGNNLLPASLRQDIVERTDGIPLFVEEMTKAVLEAEGEGAARARGRRDPSPALSVPASLHASLMARLDRLGPAKEAAQIGAAIGRDSRMPCWPRWRASRRRSSDRRSTGSSRRGLLFRQGAPPHATYLFKHALVQDAAYGTLLREQRRALHARIAKPSKANSLLLLFSVLYGFWVANIIAVNGDATRELAAQFMALAETQAAVVPLMIGHRLMGTSLVNAGQPAEARAHFDRAITLYVPAEHRPLASRFGQDVRIAIVTIRSIAQWLLGYPEAALRDVDDALKNAREMGHAATLMYALNFAVVSPIVCGNHAAASLLADELLSLADEKGAALWQAAGRILQGEVLALTGKAADAVRVITSGITVYRSTGTTLYMPRYFSYLAVAYAELGQFDEAWRSIAEATTAVETTKERWWEAEVDRIAGEIALKSPQPDTAKAEAYFERALAVAREQQAKSWELRAAMSMARLWRDQGKQDEARNLLAPVFGWFTEGFDTLDLKEAKALLDALAS